MHDDIDEGFFVHRYLKAPNCRGVPHQLYDEKVPPDGVALVTVIPEQLQLLRQVMSSTGSVLFIDGTAKTCPVDPAMLIVVNGVDPITHRTLPFFVGLASSESTDNTVMVIAETLRVARTALIVPAVMTDCTYAGFNALSQLFPHRPPLHFWCWFHCRRAIEDRLADTLRGERNTQLKLDILGRMKLIMEATSEKEYHTGVDQLLQFLSTLRDRETGGTDAIDDIKQYLMTYWLAPAKRVKWALAFRPRSLRHIQTNNRAESGFSALKARNGRKQVRLSRH